MSTYHSKLLELIAIEKNFDNYSLHIRLSFEKTITIYWEIDEYTAESLSSIANFNDKNKYRLSFYSSWDEIDKNHTSLLTSTYREQSDRINFPCSEKYINQLNAIRHIQHIDDINSLSFISTNEIQLNDQEDEKELIHNKHSHKPMFVFIAIMSIISAIILGFSNHVNESKPSFNEKALAQSISSDNEKLLVQSEENDAYSVYAEKLNHVSSRGYDRKVESIASNEPSIPFIELEESINYSVPEGNVALTFDDGPSPYSRDIVNVLKEYGVGGTFFFIGVNVKKYPLNAQYVHSNGYSIGNHSMKHANALTLSYEEQENEFLQLDKLIKELTNEDMTMIRPPYGAKNAHTLELAKKNGYKIVLWDNDPKDWKTRDAEKIYDAVINSKVSGSIILLHESEAVVNALPKIIEYLQEKNLKIVSLR